MGNLKKLERLPALTKRGAIGIILKNGEKGIKERDRQWKRESILRTSGFEGSRWPIPVSRMWMERKGI
jgi:hypothetical protein